MITVKKDAIKYKSDDGTMKSTGVLCNLGVIGGVPKGGTQGQVLTKNSDADGDLSWQSKGKKLIVEYTHSGNQELYIESMDYATGIMTLKEPHGLNVGTETDAIIAIENIDYSMLNDALSDGNKAALMKVPTEFRLQKSIKIVSIADTQIQIKNVTSINLEDTYNKDIDVSGFHLEIPKDWVITNLDDVCKTKHISIEIYGLINQARNSFFEGVIKNTKDNTLHTIHYIGLGCQNPQVGNNQQCGVAHLMQVSELLLYNNVSSQRVVRTQVKTNNAYGANLVVEYMNDSHSIVHRKIPKGSDDYVIHEIRSYFAGRNWFGNISNGSKILIFDEGDMPL